MIMMVAPRRNLSWKNCYQIEHQILWLSIVFCYTNLQFVSSSLVILLLPCACCTRSLYWMEFIPEYIMQSEEVSSPLFSFTFVGGSDIHKPKCVYNYGTNLLLEDRKGRLVREVV